MTRMLRAAPAAVATFGVAVLIAGAPPSFAAEKVPVPPPSVTVLGQSLVLKSNVTSATEDLVAEYVPEKETLDRWTLMLGVRIFKAKLAPDQAVAMKTGEVEARRAQGDYMANSMAFAKGDFKVIDFMMSQPPIVEHNVMSFSRRPDGRLVSYQIARRYYQPSSEVDDGLRTFVGEVKTNRDRYVQEIERLAKEVLK
jgi:hypothetical protein